MKRVEFRYVTKDIGESRSETVSHIDNDMTAEEYVKSLKSAGVYQADHDAINVELYDENDNLVSEYLWEREEVINVALAIKKIRGISGLSQAKFAAFYHIPKRTIESWEMGERECPDYVIQLLRRAVLED